MLGKKLFFRIKGFLIEAVPVQRHQPRHRQRKRQPAGRRPILRPAKWSAHRPAEFSG